MKTGPVKQLSAAESPQIGNFPCSSASQARQRHLISVFRQSSTMPLLGHALKTHTVCTGSSQIQLRWLKTKTPSVDNEDDEYSEYESEGFQTPCIPMFLATQALTPLSRRFPRFDGQTSWLEKEDQIEDWRGISRETGAPIEECLRRTSRVLQEHVGQPQASGRKWWRDPLQGDFEALFREGYFLHLHVALHVSLSLLPDSCHRLHYLDCQV